MNIMMANGITLPTALSPTTQKQIEDIHFIFFIPIHSFIIVLNFAILVVTHLIIKL